MRQETGSCKISIDTLVENYNVANSNYLRAFRKMMVLDAVDRSRLWEALQVKFPKYQVLPDTNWIAYIKSNILASVYTVAKSASILPTSDEDNDAIQNLNVALEYIWDKCDIGYTQMRAGHNAALFNIGVTQVGWDADLNLDGCRGNIVAKDINPMRYMRDPFAESLEFAAFCMTWDSFHESVIASDPRYAEAFARYKHKESCDSYKNAVIMPSEPINNYSDRADPSTAKDYYKVFIHFVRYLDNEELEDGVPVVKIAEIHTLNNEIILFHNNDVRPRRFPFVELFCNLPQGDPIGTSEPAKILNNNIAYNIMNSMMLTAEYKNQRPPRFINSQSGLNLRTFTQYGNDADRAFIVHGDASRAVHYHQFPAPSPVAMSLQSGLIRDVQATSGIDERYTGRDTGSVITTGGVEDMLNRVTLIDAPKILNYERYTRDLTRLIIENFVEYGFIRKYIKHNREQNTFEEIKVDYKKIRNPALLSYSVNISSELPKNKQRVASMANMVMEKQMQYGTGSGNPELITPEEWLQFQDLPFKEKMLGRMRIQRLADMTSQVAGTLFSYANLVKSGMGPDDAIAAVAQNLTAMQNGEAPPVAIPPIEEVIPPDQGMEVFDPTQEMYAGEVPYQDSGMVVDPNQFAGEQPMYPDNIPLDEEEVII